MGIDSARVRAAMAAGCFTVKALAKTANLSENTIQKALKHNDGRCNFRTIGKLAKALGLPASELIKD